MKKILALTLAVMMMTAVFAGCGGSSAPAPAAPAASAAPAAPAAPAANEPEVTLKWMVTGSTVTDEKAAMDAINAYLKEKLNVKLEMLWIGWGDFDDKATMAINGGDDVDIYFTSFWTRNEYTQMAKRGAYLMLDEILDEYAPTYFDSMNPAMKEGMVVDGAEGRGIYALPAAKELAMQYVWEMNMPVLEKYGITPDQVTDYYSLGDILDKVKQGEGADFFPLSTDTSVTSRIIEPSIFVDSNQLLSYQFDPVNPSKSAIEIKSRYETPQFKQYVEKTREYYQKGYINPAQGIELQMSPTWTDAKTSGKWAISTRVAAPGYQLADSAQYGYTIDVKNACAGVVGTDDPRGAMHAVSSISKNPEKAVQLLDLINSDVYLHDLFGHGVEGVHYTLENGRVKYIPEQKENFNVWKAGIGQLGMYTPTVDDADDVKGMIDKFNSDGVEMLPILGWSFDPNPVQNELAALASVRNEFFWPLAAGTVDPATQLPAFIDKLKANGIDKVVEEANRQLNEFMATK